MIAACAGIRSPGRKARSASGAARSPEGVGWSRARHAVTSSRPNPSWWLSSVASGIAPRVRAHRDAHPRHVFRWGPSRRRLRGGRLEPSGSPRFPWDIARRSIASPADASGRARRARRVGSRNRTRSRVLRLGDDSVMRSARAALWVGLTTAACAAPPASPDSETPLTALVATKCGACHASPRSREQSHQHVEAALARHARRVHLSEAQWSAVAEFLTTEFPPQ